jgi:hypothetical protein
MRTLLRKNDLKERWRLKSARSVTNRVKSGAIKQPPFYINGIPYWYEDEIEEAERKAAAERNLVA